MAYWRTKSKSGYRTIPLTEEAVAILNKQKEKNKWISEISKEWEEFVFLCRKGTPVKNSTYDTALFKICDKAQIPRFSMHILKHTFATRCIEAGTGNYRKHFKCYWAIQILELP